MMTDMHDYDYFERVPEEFNFEDLKVGDYKLKEEKKMDNGVLTLSWINIKSALVYGVIAVILAIIAKGTVFGLDWRVLVDVGVMGILTSFVKNIFTTNKGNFLGAVEVVDSPSK